MRDVYMSAKCITYCVIFCLIAFWVNCSHAGFLHFDYGKGVIFQVDLEIKMVSDLAVTRVRMSLLETYVVKVSNCTKGAGIIYMYDPENMKFKGSFDWRRDGPSVGDIIGTAICKNVPK